MSEFRPGSATSDGFFGVVTRLQSYLNILYLLIAFPLGIFYFVFLVTGLSMGLGLTLIGIGLVVLFLVLAVSRGLCRWERLLANSILGLQIPWVAGPPISWRQPWTAFKTYLGDPQTWKGMLFLLLKFPLGIISFVFVVVLLSVTIALIVSPLALFSGSMDFGSWSISSPEVGLLVLCVGLLVGVISLHAMNGLAAVWRALSGWALKGTTGPHPVPQALPEPLPERSGPIIIP